MERVRACDAVCCGRRGPRTFEGSGFEKGSSAAEHVPRARAEGGADLADPAELAQALQYYDNNIVEGGTVDSNGADDPAKIVEEQYKNQKKLQLRLQEAGAEDGPRDLATGFANLEQDVQDYHALVKSSALAMQE